MRAFLKYLMKYTVPLIVTVGLCWLLFTSLDFNEMMHIIATQCNFGWIAAAMLVSVFSHVFRAMRWGLQLRALGIRTPLYVLIYSIFGTYAVNLVFPRLGEVWRTGYVAQRQGAPFSTVFGSMIADRLADTLTVLLLLLLTFVVASSSLISYFSENAPMWHKLVALVSSPWLWAAVALVIAVGALVVVKSAHTAVMQKAKAFLKGLWQGFAVIATMPGKGLWLLLTVCVWGCYFFQLYLAFFAFPFTADVAFEQGIAAVLVTFVLSSIAMGVPSNGGIGPWQWAVIFALGIYGVATEQAGAFANLVLGTNTLLLIVLGIVTFVGIALDKKSHKPTINNPIENISRK